MRLQAFGVTCEVTGDRSVDLLAGLSDLETDQREDPDPAQLCYSIERAGPEWLERCYQVRIAGDEEPLFTVDANEISPRLLDDLGRRAGGLSGGIGLTASVVVRNGSAVLFAATGDGPIGAVLADQINPVIESRLLDTGWSCLSTRQSAIFDDDGTPSALPFWRPRPTPVAPAGDAPRRHDPNHLTPLSAQGSLADRSPLGAIVLTSLRAAPSVETLSAVTALRHLLGRLVEPVHEDAAERLDSLARLVEMVPCFEVGVSPNDPSRSAPLFDDVLTSTYSDPASDRLT